MAPFGASYNPANVMFGRPTGGGVIKSGPYVDTGDGGSLAGVKLPMQPSNVGPTPKKPINFASAPPAQPSGLTSTVGPRTVRATGSSPFDPAYRQNLASYAGGQFGGNLSFNPTDISSFPGQPTGGGTAPVTGMPTSLLDMALAGQGFSWNPPQPAQTATQPPQYGDMQSWMDQFMRNGRGLRMGAIA